MKGSHHDLDYSSEKCLIRDGFGFLLVLHMFIQSTIACQGGLILHIDFLEIKDVQHDEDKQ
jgi:hypothetical protein